MMNKALIVAALVSLTTFIAPVEASPVTGTVTNTRTSCGYFLVETPAGYAVLEWYSGAEASDGDTLVGSIDTYGFHDIYNETSAASMHVWVEDYGLDEDDSFEKLNEKCS